MNKIRDLLLLGDRKAAVDVAVQSQMWPEAMLIGSFTDKDEYKVGDVCDVMSHL